MNRIGIIIPAYNEAEALPLVLSEVGDDLIDSIVVVDNGSDDGTGRIAAETGAHVVKEPCRGYGAACLKGIDFFRTRPVDIVVFMDADRSVDPGDLPALTEPILRGDADLVIGSRILGEREKGSLVPQARYGNALATTLMRLFFKTDFTDLGPFRAIRFDKLLALEMEDRNFGWTVEMQVKAAKMGLESMEVPVRYRRRVGRSKISGTLSGTLRAGTKILWTIFKNLG
ncbi:glycosyltransferase family 2 protein [Thermodesulfobacteriota bacterium]